MRAGKKTMRSTPTKTTKVVKRKRIEALEKTVNKVSGQLKKEISAVLEGIGRVDATLERNKTEIDRQLTQINGAIDNLFKSMAPDAERPLPAQSTLRSSLGVLADQRGAKPVDRNAVKILQGQKRTGSKI
jgi:hypothetical protein